MMKSKLLNSLILAALAVPGVAMAADAAPAPLFTANVALVTNYLYRGISQTGGKPAIQGGFDYAHSSGFYAGVWGSNISWIGDLVPTGTAGATVPAWNWIPTSVSRTVSPQTSAMTWVSCATTILATMLPGCDQG